MRARVWAAVLCLAAAGPPARAEEVFYLVSEMHGRRVDSPPRKAINPFNDRFPGNPHPIEDALVRHDLMTNRRTEVLRFQNAVTEAVGVSAAGDRLAVLSRRSKQADTWQITVADATGRVLQTVTSDDFRAAGLAGYATGAPVPSPDGTRLCLRVDVVTRTGPRQGEYRTDPRLAVYTLATGACQVVGTGLSPAWSPDGKTIVYTDLGPDPEAVRFRTGARTHRLRLALVDADGRNPRPIAGEGTFAGVFSPDGTKIAYLKLGPGCSDLHTCDAAGNGHQRLAVPRSVLGTPRWLSDNRRLLVAADEPDMRAAVAATQARAKTKKDGAAAPPPPPARLPRDYTPNDRPRTDLFVVGAGQNVRRVSLTPGQPHMLSCHLDRRADDEVRWAARVWTEEHVPEYKPPAGHRVVITPTEAHLRDKAGQRKPLPDGLHRVRDRVLLIRGGELVANDD